MLAAELSVTEYEDVSALFRSRYKREGKKPTDGGGKKEEVELHREEREQEGARKTRRIKESKREGKKDKNKQTNKVE